MAEPTKTEVNQFVKVVDDFMREYDRLKSPATQAKVYGSGDRQLIADYENAINNGGRLRGAILATTGTWQNAKAAYQAATAQSSMAIGDAIDWFRQKYFGYDPAGGMGGLGAFQLPAAAWLAGITGSAYLLLKTFKELRVRIDAAVLRRENPGIPYDEALTRARAANASDGLFSLGNMPLWLGGLAAVYLLTR